jgi:hypothetical protein
MATWREASGMNRAYFESSSFFGFSIFTAIPSFNLRLIAA